MVLIKKTRNLGPKGRSNIKINNLNELKTLATSNQKISVVISKNLGCLKKKKIMELALKMDIKIINPTAEN